MKIRQAIREDALALAALIFSSAPQALSAVFNINSEKSALKFLQFCLSSADGQFGFVNHWVIEINHLVVGCFSAWHCEIPKSFHQATFKTLIEFYGTEHALKVIQASQALQESIPTPQKSELCIGHFAVLSQYQRQGIASEMMNVAHNLARDLGFQFLTLDVASSNESAINFYEKRGFIQESKSGVGAQMQAKGIGEYIHFKKLI